MTTHVGLKERSTHVYTATIKDENSVVVPAASLNTMTLTLYAERTGTIINSRSQQNILNANNVTISSGGVLVWTMQPADNAIVNSALSVEPHIALFEWTYSSGTKYGKHQIRLMVENYTKVS